MTYPVNTRTFLIFGQEPLQQKEAIDDILLFAKENNFFDKKIINNIDDLEKSYSEISMFCSNMLIRLDLTNSKITSSIINKITNFLKTKRDDLILYILTKDAVPKINPHIDFIISAKPIPEYKWQGWVKDRIKKENFNIELNENLIQILANNYHANPVALVNFLKILKISENNLSNINEISNINPMFSIFDLTQHAISGDKLNAIKILKSLETNKIEPAIILWALTKEIRDLIALQTPSYPKPNIWQSKLNYMNTACKRLSLEKLHNLLILSAKIDNIIKGITKGNSYIELTKLSLELAV